jgi:hypothetical protein
VLGCIRRVGHPIDEPHGNGRVDDDRLISAGAVDFLHAEAVPLQPSFGLRGDQIHIEAIAFEFFHCGHCRSVWPDVSSSLQIPPYGEIVGVVARRL